MTAAILVPAVAFVAWFIIATVRWERAEMAKLDAERRKRQAWWSAMRAETQASIVEARRLREQFVQDAMSDRGIRSGMAMLADEIVEFPPELPGWPSRIRWLEECGYLPVQRNPCDGLAVTACATPEGTGQPVLSRAAEDNRT